MDGSDEEFCLFPKCEGDDELFCDIPCPEGCLCQGLAFICTKPFPANKFRNLRYLNADGSGMKTEDLLDNVFLVGLSLSRLSSLQIVYTDDYKLCCEATLPEHFDVDDCHTQKNEIASCEDLLHSNLYRVSLWIFASLALVGNAGSFVSRFYLQKQATAAQTSFNLFVTNLCLADFLMGMYLAVIGVADQVYRGRYLWYDEEWKTSPACKIAGFLSLVSSEVSAFNICLITLDRFLVLRFPLGKLRFRKWSAVVACVVTWLVGILLAAVPLFPITSHWEFYSQNGICIPLPITSHTFAGHKYSFGVMIVLNFALFLLIAVGQVSIYWSVRTNSMSTTKTKRSRDATIARRLATIVLSDFLCWFPIGLLGLLASTGTHISNDVNVGIAIFVLPFNSALNPFLYTFNVLMEKRMKATESRIMASHHAEDVATKTFVRLDP
nr:hypothetical protein BaRGS_015066 [Batillaria attramentaria]